MHTRLIRAYATSEQSDLSSGQRDKAAHLLLVLVLVVLIDGAERVLGVLKRLVANRLRAANSKRDLFPRLGEPLRERGGGKGRWRSARVGKKETKSRSAGRDWSRSAEALRRSMLAERTGREGAL